LQGFFVVISAVIFSF